MAKRGYAQQYPWISVASCAIRKEGTLFNSYARELGFDPGRYLRVFMDRGNLRVAYELLPPDLEEMVQKVEGYKLWMAGYPKMSPEIRPVYTYCPTLAQVFPNYIGVVTPLVQVPNRTNPTHPLFVTTFNPNSLRADPRRKRGRPKSGDPHAKDRVPPPPS